MTPAIRSAGCLGAAYAVTLLDGEDERAGVVRAGRVKLGVELAAGARIGEKSADRGGYVLHLADYEATVLGGVPVVPQPDDSMTQYTACRYTRDPGTLAEAAARGSLCAQVFLERQRSAGRKDGEPGRPGASAGNAVPTSNGPRPSGNGSA